MLLFPYYLSFGEVGFTVSLTEFQTLHSRWAGSTPLHLAARGGCLGCVRELLTWGADRLQRDSSG